MKTTKKLAKKPAKRVKKEEDTLTVKHFYLRDKDRRPVACVASVVDGEKQSFAIATHNPIDPYKKSIGRQLAFGRLLEARGKFHVKLEGVQISKAVILASLVHAPDMPTRVRKAAAYQLEQRGLFTQQLEEIASVTDPAAITKRLRLTAS